MITVKVGDTPLYIPKETTLVLEQSNNVFSDDGIISDIIWSFEIPAKPNQAILGAVQYLYCSGNRRYDCEVAVDGILILSGYLYIQSSKDETRLTCGIVANSFGTGFGDKKLKENNYGSPVVISETEEGHQAGWRQFLLGSLTANSIYKFFPFVDSKFYKDNEEYGMYNGSESPLANTFVKDKGYTIGYVNRLFFTKPTSSTVAIVEDDITQKRGCRLFNKTNQSAQNGYCFAPAIRLDWLIKKVFSSAGLEVGGSFFQSQEIKRLFIQSMCAMDGSSIQYDKENMLTLSGIDSVGNNGNGQNFTVEEIGSATKKSFYNRKPVVLKANYSLRLDKSDLHSSIWQDVDRYDEDDNPIYTYHETNDVYAIMICKRSGYTWPKYRMKVEVPNGGDPFIYGTMKSISQITDEAEQGLLLHDLHWREMLYVKNGWMKVKFWREALGVVYNDNFVRQVTPLTPADCYFLQITPSRGYRMSYDEESDYIKGEASIPNTFTSSIEGSGNKYRPMHNINEECCIRLVKFNVHSYQGHNLEIEPVSGNNYKVESEEYGRLEYLSGFEVLGNVDVGLFDPSLNIFSRVLDWKKHLPNLSNGEFLSVISKAFGLAMFVNPISKQAQLSFFSDVWKTSCLDISEWVTNKERLEYSPKEYKVSFSPTLGEDKTTKENIIEERKTKESTPSAFMNLNKHAFILNEAAYRQANIEERVYSWKACAGDSRQLEAGIVGAENTEEVGIDICIPNMTYADEGVSGTEEKYLCQIEQEGCSPMLDKEYTGEFPLIIQQYNGQRQITAGESQLYIEDANPTIYNQDGTENTDACSLSTVGKRSIGEKWLKQVYDFLGDCDQYRLTAYVPSWVFCKIMDTLRPQSGNLASHKRWIYCNGQKFIPTKISSEISDHKTIIVTIECAAPHIDL